MSVSGVCFDFRVALVGPPKSGKTRFARYWSTATETDAVVAKKMPFDAATSSSSSSAAVTFPYVPTTFTDMYHLDIDVRECLDASAHRVHVLDTPGDPSRHCFFRSVLAQRALGAVDLCVFFAVPSGEGEDGGDAADSEAVSTTDMLAEAAEICEASVAEKGQPVDLLVLDLSSSERQQTRPLDVRGVRGPGVITAASVLVLDEYDDVLIANAVVKMLCEAHRRRCQERELVAERSALAAEAKLRKAALTTSRAAPLPARPIDARFAVGHVSDPDFCMSIVMLGLPGVGRSTFLASALDGFVLRDYEPTYRPDSGSFNVMFGGRVANATLHDGPVQHLVKTAQATLIFVDPTSFSAEDDARSLVEGLDLNSTVAVVLSTVGKRARPDENVELWSDADLARFAGSLRGFYMAGVDPREDNSDVLVSVVCQVVQAQNALRQSFAREIEMMEQRCLPSQAFHSLGCSKLMRQAATPAVALSSSLSAALVAPRRAQ